MVHRFFSSRSTTRHAPRNSGREADGGVTAWPVWLILASPVSTVTSEMNNLTRAPFRARNIYCRTSRLTPWHNFLCLTETWQPPSDVSQLNDCSSGVRLASRLRLTGVLEGPTHPISHLNQFKLLLLLPTPPLRFFDSISATLHYIVSLLTLKGTKKRIVDQVTLKTLLKLLHSVEQKI